MTVDESLILFDVGGVLVKLNFDRFGNRAAELNGEGLTAGEFLEQYSGTGLEKDYLLGNISTPVFISGLESIVSSTIGKKISDDELRRLAVSHLDDAITDMVDLKLQLQYQGYRVGIFSNTAELHYMHISERFPDVYSSANPLILSFQQRLAKPDRRMYELVRHSNVVFIDDSQIYIDLGTQEFGWRGIVYQGSIDSSEPQRKRDEISSTRAGSLSIANSAQEVRQCLEEFGIDLK